MNLTLFQSEIEKQAGLVLGKLIGGTVDGALSTGGNLFGGLFGDRIREWRTRNLISQFAKTAEFLQAKGIPLEKARALPMGEAYAMFEESSKQDDPDVIDMWAALLANAMDEQNGSRIEPAYVAALRTFSGVEAHILKLLFEVAKETDEYTRSYKELGENMWSSNGANNAALDAQKKLNNARSKYKINCSQIFDAHMSHIAVGQIHIAISNLIAARCASIFDDHHQFMDLTKTEYIEGAPFEYLDKRKVQGEFIAVRRALMYAGGAISKLPNLRDDYGDESKINYRLTEFGERLVRACEQPAKTT
jgi:transcriptional regulator with XRE-family HTH domain